MKSQTGLVRRKPSGIYYFRARVPKLLIPLLKNENINDSLWTTNKVEASALVAKRRHEMALELQRLRKGTSDRLGVQERMFLADEEVQAICERYLVHLLKSDDDYRLEGMTSTSSDLHKDILDSYADSIMSSVARGEAHANNSDRVSTKRIYQYGPNCVRDSRDLRAALAMLAERGRARMEEDGRRRAVAINPALLDERT